jgi:hypothetical protein
MTIDEDEQRAIMEAVQRLFALWQLTDEQSANLLGATEKTWTRFQSGDHDGPIAADIWKRAASLLSIHASLQVLIGKPQCLKWIQRPNSAPMFAGQSALDTMIDGGLPAIQRVKKYLQAELAQ